MDTSPLIVKVAPELTIRPKDRAEMAAAMDFYELVGWIEQVVATNAAGSLFVLRALATWLDAEITARG